MIAVIFILQAYVTAVSFLYAASMWQIVRLGRNLSTEARIYKKHSDHTLAAKEWWLKRSYVSLAAIVVGAIAIAQIRRAQGDFDPDWVFWFIHEPSSFATVILTVVIRFWKSGRRDREHHLWYAYPLALCSATMFLSGLYETWWGT